MYIMFELVMRAYMLYMLYVNHLGVPNYPDKEGKHNHLTCTTVF